MRLSIDHRTTYRFSAPQRRLVQLLRLTPADSHDQTVARWDIHVGCDARLRPARDGFGNLITMLYAEGDVERIEIAVTGEVVTGHADGVVHGVAEPLPPALYLRSTALTPRDPAIAAWAADAAGGDDPLARLHALNRALHARAADRAAGDPARDASAAWEAGAASPRDLAHVFIVAARAIGAPARFVSGYRLPDRAGAHAPRPHAWAEAHVDGLGWVGFDPAAGLCPEERYVRVAMALDAAGAAPVAGSRTGGGEEALEADVAVSGA
jgi:transglutaminase-like putative cysteine protease